MLTKGSQRQTRNFNWGSEWFQMVGIKIFKKILNDKDVYLDLVWEKNYNYLILLPVGGDGYLCPFICVLGYDSIEQPHYYFNEILIL